MNRLQENAFLVASLAAWIVCIVCLILAHWPCAGIATIIAIVASTGAAYCERDRNNGGN